MKRVINVFISILLASGWIVFSEFVRNEWLFKRIWENHYQVMGLTYPAEPLNGVIWGVWSMFMAIFIFVISRKFSLLSATFLAWFACFVLMWLVVGNLGVLPLSLLYYAVPLSLLEVFVATLIIRKISG
ncbi:hypothetical protein [Marinilabilia rubra]|uniref:Uncharacterized protein n=1 Tax=Marinilabilia rubra TaxID=2162893 RepID=A0A2U2B8Y3_9BACT|nr:hypothetical protein [Marinilabilia rubra]PWD99541.1 hypothetical protein DDZ16_08785 [Marinilabilia rubra]